MQVILSEPISRFSDFDTDVKRLGDDFKAHMRMWGGVLATAGAGWAAHGLPVDPARLAAACTRLCFWCSSAQAAGVAADSP
eukprot:m.172412 g.172412  ORF g.172412 m.172412 type:complete len:81 (+) comp9945_c0_seq13:124-366(+)